MFTIKSITGLIHDTGYGGYPYKVVVMIDIPVKEFNKLCPIANRTRDYFGKSTARRDLGQLVINVNNTVYDLNQDIPAHNPSIDSQGHSRAKNGIKTMEFVYFLRDHTQAEKLGFEVRRFKNGECMPVHFQQVNLLEPKSVSRKEIKNENH